MPPRFPKGYLPTVAAPPVARQKQKHGARSSPTKRTLQLLRREGFTPAVVERWNPHARGRQDLFGFIDILAIHPDHAGKLGVQCTTTANQAARLTKALAAPALQVWLQAQNQFQIWGWRRSRKSRRWNVTRRTVTVADVKG
jgi:hypothetical protein